VDVQRGVRPGGLVLASAAQDPCSWIGLTEFASAESPGCRSRDDRAGADGSASGHPLVIPTGSLPQNLPAPPVDQYEGLFPNTIESVLEAFLNF